MPTVFEAIGDPSRREILALLSGRSLPAGQIARRFDQQRPAISKHLAFLKKAGVLIEVRDRQRRLYSLTPGALEPVMRWLGGLAPATRVAAKSRPLRPRTRRDTPRQTSPPPAPRPRSTNFDLDFD